MWGFGHTATLFLIGAILLVFGATIPEYISSSLEGVVGIMLVVLGISVFLRVRNDSLHIHEHEHDGDKHAHIHSHKKTDNHQHEHKSFFVGLVHGLAGSGALLLIVLSTAESVLQGLFFIAVFGVGSIFGMTLVSLLIGYFISRIDKFKKAQQLVQITAGSISTFVGILLISESFFL
jgi:sulfite exporter TauE/SafE